MERRKCVERQAPFATAGKEGENGFRDFFDHLELLNSLRGCTHSAQFVGVVLDDSRRHLKGYLYESPLIASTNRFLDVADLHSIEIPWPIRENLARQIIEAVSEIHEKGLIVGVFNIRPIGIRADGTAIIYRFSSSQRHLLDQWGETPPETRLMCQRNNVTQCKTLNFRTDIFQLGLILWHLAEHRPYRRRDALSCSRSACNSRPRYSCNADHANPVLLPPSTEAFPLILTT